MDYQENYQQKLKEADLFNLTGMDWELIVHHLLSEPTCPTACVRPEGADGWTRYTAHANTIDKAVQKACELAYREVVLGETIESQWPITNVIDREIEKAGGIHTWLKEQRRKEYGDEEGSGG